MRSEQTGGGAATTPGSRSANERLILSLIRRRGELPKADLARLTGLSATAVGAIIRQLEADGLVSRGAPQKGQIGQPSVPYSLAADGAFSLGLKIGRRSAELVLLDATLAVRDFAETVYAHPAPDAVRGFAEAEAERMLRRAGTRERLVGLGVALPSEMWSWSAEMDAAEGALEAWRGLDPSAVFDLGLGAPVFAVNDATAACAAQLAIDPPRGANGRAHVDFAYFFVGWFIGGGVVLDGKLREGRRGDAGAFGSMPVYVDGDEPEQLIRSASLFRLERELQPPDGALERLWGAGSDWTTLGDALERWLERAATGVAQAAAAAAAVIDFEAVIIDGSFPEEVRARFTAMARERFERLDRQGLRQGLAPLEIQEGSVGRAARAIGAGCLPLLANFAVEEAAIAELGAASG